MDNAFNYTTKYVYSDESVFFLPNKEEKEAPTADDNADTAVAVVLSDARNHVLDTAGGTEIVILVAIPFRP